MVNCQEQIYSNEYFDFIIGYGEAQRVPVADACIQRIDEDYDIFYYNRQGLPPLGIGYYTYTATPKCYGLQDTTALEVSGIIRMQNIQALQLKGSGVLIGVIDTGIDYTNPLFRFSDGSSRILSIWDQSIPYKGGVGKMPEGIAYGTEYSREAINLALENENPLSVVPSIDSNGHGTFLTGVACGGEDVANDFIGAAPFAEIAVVKLKEAKKYLRDFYFIPSEVPAYQENDIMMAVAYLNQLANVYNLPLVICMTLGTSMGSHGRDGFLSSYLNYISTRRKRVVITATGNEANSRHHFLGRIEGEMEYEDVEISVTEDMEGFFVELWAVAPALYSVAVISPSGEILQRSNTGESAEYRFLFENTVVTVDYRIESSETANQLIFLRFAAPKRGLWIIRVYGENPQSGSFNLWLPMEQMLGGEVFFIRSNPDITITSPGMSLQVITVGGYNAFDNSILAVSGRGYTAGGQVKPDFVAPAVNVWGPGLRNDFISKTGSSVACAIAAGGCAQIMEWAFVLQNEPKLSAAGIKNMLIRGTNQEEIRSYPNREWGYGTLDVYQAFNNLRML